MTELVKVPFGKTKDQAILLLAAAEELGLASTVVRTTTGAFLVPAEVEKQAFSERDADKSEPKKTAKKAPAKKAAAKKSPTTKAQE